MLTSSDQQGQRSMDQPAVIELSVVIPLFNEAPCLPELHRQLTDVLGRLDRTYEVIYVDDGSTDESFAVLQQLHRDDTHVRVVQLRRNCGKSAALDVGLRMCRGAIIVTMDADLQDDPREIEQLLQRLDEGYDLVTGWRRQRADRLIKRWSSRLFNGTTGLFTGIHLHDFNCGLKAFRAPVARELKVYGEMHRYLPVLAYWRGFAVTEVLVAHHRRAFGRSKFGAERFLRGFWDFVTVVFLTKYIRRPLHLFGPMGLLAFILGLIINLYLSALWFSGIPIGHRPLLTLGVLLMILGIQSISIGLLGEMITSRDREYGQDVPVGRRLDRTDRREVRELAEGDR